MPKRKAKRVTVNRRRLCQRTFLIPAVIVALSCLCICLFFGANQTDTDADIQTGEKGIKSLIEIRAAPTDITAGTQSQRGFLNDNTLHSSIGDIHYSSYIPESYDGSEPYALFITLPGWEGLYFQGVGANMAEDFGTEAIHYNDRMIVLSTQLDDWGETSA